MWWRNLRVTLIAAVCLLVAASLATSVGAQQNAPTDQTALIQNLEFQGSDIRAAMTLLAEHGGANVVVAPDVSGTVTIRLRNINWRDAMDIIGRTYDLAIVDDESGYVRVMKSETYREELTKQREHDANQMKLVALETKIIKISNSVAADMVATVENLLTDRGKVVADERSNSLVIQEVPENLKVVLDYIAELDSPARQIKISAQLLEISSDGMQELGVNWKVEGAYTTDNGRVYNQTGEVMADIGSEDPIGRYSVQVLSHDWNVDAFVEAVVKSGKGKIIAHPEITTVENKEARIQMGQKVPVKQFDESGNVVIKFEEIGTILICTPHITAENQVLMHLRPERSTFEYDAAGVIINTNNAETNVIVANGQTAVIGGLTTQDEVETEYGVPLLKDIPILGQLFKFTTKSSESRDLVIFVTPTIADGDLAMNP